MIYLDTSVLVAYYLPETLSDLVQQRLHQASAVVVSELAQTEFASALALRYRRGDLSLTDAQQVEMLFSSHLSADLYRTLHLNSAVFQQAYAFVSRFDLPIKAPDALHLAAAKLEEVPLVTADRQMARNAEMLQIDVELIIPAE